jgi:hypothetical protein
MRPCVIFTDSFIFMHLDTVKLCTTAQDGGLPLVRYLYILIQEIYICKYRSQLDNVSTSTLRMCHAEVTNPLPHPSCKGYMKY